MGAEKIAVVFGGSGFVGRYVVQRLAREGWRVRVPARRPNEAIFLKTYGDVGQIETVLANVRSRDSVRAAVSGAGAVVNCAGILAQCGSQRFDAVHAAGAGFIAEAAKACGAASLVHVSAIGADPEGGSAYARSKALGESLVLRHFKRAVILRPSVVFGAEDRFFNRFAAMARALPVLPIVGAGTRFQPVFVDDVAKAAALAAAGRARPGVYELGGPDVETFERLMRRMLGAVKRSRIIFPMPFWMAGPLAFSLDMLQALSLGLLRNQTLTRDQVRLLRHDNVVGEGSRSLQRLGVKPKSMDAILGKYLYPYRPSGQFSEVVDSGSRMKDQL